MRILIVGVLLTYTLSPADAEFLTADHVDPSAGTAKETKGPVILSAPLPVDPDYGKNIRLGQGYNVFNGEFSQEADCVAAVRQDSEAGKEKLSEANRKYVNFVTDMANHEDASSASAGISFAYKLLTVGASEGVNSDSYFNTIDEYARIYRRVVTRITNRVGGDWGPGARPIIDRGLRHDAVMRRFTEVCGTHYVSAIYYGHVVDETIRFKLSEKKRMTQERESFSAGVKELFSANYDNKKTETDVRNVSSLDYIHGSHGVIATGAPDVTVAGGIRSLVKYAIVDFDNAVALLKPNESVPIAFEVSPYYGLNISQQNYFPRTDAVLSVLTERLSLFELLLTNVSQLKFASSELDDAARSEFYEDDAAKIEAKLSLAIAYIDNYRDVVETSCLKVIKPEVSDTEVNGCRTALQAALTPKMIDATRIARKN